MNNIRITNITDVDSFFKVIDQCSGEVLLVTSEGDQLNLRSKLCQYVSLSNIFAEGKIKEITLRIADSQDVHLLLKYLITC